MSGAAPGYAMARGIIKASVLKTGERHWPHGWEQDSKVLACEHSAWELVVIQFVDGSGNEAVIRCTECHAPRCGHTSDRDPCMLVRHHRGFAAVEHHPLSRWVPDLTDSAAVEEWLDS